MKKKTLLTGDRPTGPLHIGHYVGSLKNRIKMQSEYETFIMIADSQAITDNFDNIDKVRENVLQVVADYLACGIDPAHATIFIQSMIPQLPEENLDKIPLAKYNRIRGRLFIKKINKTTTSGKKQLEPMIQRHDYAELYNLEILDKKVVICGQWVDDTSENNRNALYFNHEIFADEIYWETDPSIIDPFLDYPP